MKNLTLLIFLIALQCQLFSQTDTLVSYNVRTKEIKIVNSNPVIEDKNFDFTQWNYGSESGFVFLPAEKPNNTYNNSGFTDYYPVQYLFPVDKYPIRTAVKLFTYIEDTLKQICSGIMIAKDLVLTACHCIEYYDTSTKKVEFFDSLLAAPAYDNGLESSLYTSSRSESYYLFKNTLSNQLWKDIAIIKLQEPIGIKTGWIGIAFSDDDSFLKNNIFHKLSYPGTVDFSDSTRIFNGDTLYYNYGTLDVIRNNSIGYNIFGIKGQSGSSLFYTDNNQYYSFGVLSFATQSNHYRIDKNTFYTFHSLIEESNITSVEKEEIPEGFYLYDAYPNPFNPSTSIQYAIGSPANGINTQFVTIKVFDLLGKEIAVLVNENKYPGNYKVEFNGNNLSSGMYIYTLHVNSQVISKKMILLK